MNYIEWAEEYEANAQKVLEISYRTAEKAKSADGTRKSELIESAHRYNMIAREMLMTARELRRRTIKGGHEAPDRSGESSPYELVNIYF